MSHIHPPHIKSPRTFEPLDDTATNKIVKSIFIDEIKVHINFMKYKRDISKSLWAEHSWGTKYLNLSRRTMKRHETYEKILIFLQSITYFDTTERLGS